MTFNISFLLLETIEKFHPVFIEVGPNSAAREFRNTDICEHADTELSVGSSANLLLPHSYCFVAFSLLSYITHIPIDLLDIFCNVRFYTTSHMKASGTGSSALFRGRMDGQKVITDPTIFSVSGCDLLFYTFCHGLFSEHNFPTTMSF